MQAAALPLSNLTSDTVLGGVNSPASNGPIEQVGSRQSTVLAWRAPRLRLLTNGLPIQGVVEAGVTSNNHYAADRFSAVMAIGADLSANAAYWASETNILADVQFSLDGGATFASLIQGLVDTVAIDVLTGTLRIEGRDLTAAMIENRTQETFANRTSSEIATILAQRHNLTPVVTPTTTPVGRYYQNEHDRIALNQFSRSMTEWDLLIFLAGQEDFDVFVSGTSLYFQPVSGSLTVPYTVTPNHLQDLRLERSLTLARDIVVTVKSWNSRQQNAFTQTVRASGRRGSGTNSAGQAASPQHYVFVRPNLTMNDALKLAQQKAAELTQHERVWEATMPGDLTLDPRNMIQLVGTATDFDQTYFIDVIDRHLSIDHGFIQHVRARNTSPRVSTTTPADVVGSVTG
jgi:phage protein D